MTTEKRGSEKLLAADCELCALTAEELSQVSGALGPIGQWGPGDSFPHGTVNPDLFTDLLIDDKLLKEKPLIDAGRLVGLDARVRRF